MSSPTVILEPGRLERQYWRDLWRYRELLGFLAWRDVVVHYKQTLIGVAWAVLRPLATTAVFVLVFSRLAKVPRPPGVDSSALLVLAGMLPWQLFATTLSEASNSLVTNSHLISKIYFPRLLIPLAAVAVSLVDLLVSLPVLAALMAWEGHYPPAWRLLALPLLVALAAAAALGAGLWLAALNVRYRDVRYLIPFLVQFGLYLSPVGFSIDVVPHAYRPLYALNPMVAVIEGFRWALLGTDSLDGTALGLSAAVTAVLLAGGLWYFRRTERTFADVI
jgi:lipopolysaccharide transport system permease protein